ncbi:MAG: 4Fe-4S binding protein [Desulfobacterales bacterium]|nr:4Fe-4S binding protein [Desulfobacterales bacterium]
MSPEATEKKKRRMSGPAVTTALLPRRNADGARGWVQIGVFIATIAVGIQFYIYVSQASGTGPITVQRPPGVEGFLPIGALMGWKLFLKTGLWDPVHPAAMVILGFAGFVSLALRKSFCSWFCPVGSLSEWAWKLGRRVMGKNFRLPKWLDIPLRGLKYLLLGFFVWVIFNMGVDAIQDFLHSGYYKMSDVKMLHFFTKMTGLTAGVLTFLVVASFFVQNFWCRYLCPYGALMGLFAAIGPTRIRRDPDACIGCERCAAACSNQLPVDRKSRIISPECSGCMDCVLVCPVENTLSMKTAGAGKKAWTTVSAGIFLVLLFIGTVYTARISGVWQTRVPERETRVLLQNIDAPQFTHPGMSDR